MSVPRETLAGRLRARRPEIEQALHARTTAPPNAFPDDDPEYLEGIRTAVSAGFDYGVSVIESGEGEPPPVPAELLTQARLAARRRVELDAVLRSYVAGSYLLDDYILDSLPGGDPQPLLRSRAAALELLLSRVSTEYARERARRERSSEHRGLERVTRALRGDPSQIASFDYALDLNHVGLATRGPDASTTARALSKELDSSLLLVQPDEATTWAWLGRRGPIYADDVQAAAANLAGSTSVAIGEVAAGVVGWRQTHRQAKTALAVALRSSNGMARYADVCLIASALEDSLLRTSLREIYIQPLLVGKDGGAIHLQTLRAYFAAHRNGKSTASALGVSRQAIANRLRVIEERIGRPLPSCATAMEIALGLDDSGTPL